MSNNRSLMLVAASIVLLFVLSVGISRCNGRRPLKLTDPWAIRLSNLLAHTHTFDPGKDVAPTNGWDNGRWTVSNTVPNATLVILPSKKSIRRATLTIETGACLRVEFQPKRKPRPPANFMDEAAQPLTNSLTDNSSLELVFLSAGGTLNVYRSNVTGIVSLTLRSLTGANGPARSGK